MALASVSSTGASVASETLLYFEEAREKQLKLVPHWQVGEAVQVNDLAGELSKQNAVKDKPQEEQDKKQVSVQAYLPKGVQAVGAGVQWNRGITGKGVLVGIIDTGIASHPDLANKVVVRRVYTGEVGQPVNFHGTHVAGSVAANGLIRGVAYEALLGDYRVLNNAGSGSYDAIVAAVYDAVRDGASVLNMSLGGPFDYLPLRAAIQYAYNQNVAVIVAAGNEGDGNVVTSEFSYPAMYPTTESVGAADYRGSQTAPAWFTNSNYEVDVCSQGVNVLSTAPGGTYLYLSGTSMASPHIAGVAALLVQQYRLANKLYTTANIYSDLASLAKDIYLPARDNMTGYGFVTFLPNL